MKIITFLLLMITTTAFSQDKIKPHWKSGAVPVYDNKIYPEHSIYDSAGYYYDGLSRQWILKEKPTNYTTFFYIAGGVIAIFGIGYLIGFRKGKLNNQEVKKD